MSTTMILLLGACCIGVIAVAGAVVNSPDPSEPKRPRGYQGQHGTASDVAAWTTQAPRLTARRLEEQFVSFPVGHPEQAQPVRRGEPVDTLIHAMVEWAAGSKERTEEQPVVEPVVHLGAVEGWSPKDELPAAAPLDPDRTVVRLAAGRHRRLTRTVSEERKFARELDRKLGPVLDQLARVGHEDTDTCEWTAEEFAALRARAGAR
jgi:hypothetical protein